MSGSDHGRSPSVEVNADAILPRDLEWIRDLGGVVAVGVVPPARRAVWIPLLLAAWAIPILIGGFLIGVAITKLAGIADPGAVLIAGVAWAVAFAIVGAWIGSRAFRAVVIFENGVGLRDATRIRAWRWDEIVSVVHRPSVERPDMPTDAMALVATAIVVVMQRLAGKPHVRVEKTYTFADKYGATFTIDRWLGDHARLADQIDAEVSQRLLPAMAKSFDSDQPVRFGAIELSWVAGLRVGKLPAIPWREVAACELDRDTLRVRSRTGAQLAACPIAHVTNLSVLLLMLRRVAPQVSAPASAVIEP